MGFVLVVPVLYLGVIDVPYAAEAITTGEVAHILEAKYGVMQTFVDTVGQDSIAKALENSAVNAIESMIMGAGSGINLTAEGEGEIEAAFRQFLEQQDMDGRVDGVPTKASLKGVSHRLKRPNAKDNPSRPSFIDTGLYSASMKAWTDER